MGYNYVELATYDQITEEYFKLSHNYGCIIKVEEDCRYTAIAGEYISPKTYATKAEAEDILEVLAMYAEAKSTILCLEVLQHMDVRGGRVYHKKLPNLEAITPHATTGKRCHILTAQEEQKYLAVCDGWVSPVCNTMEEAEGALQWLKNSSSQRNPPIH
jgi:hypothetical protein